MCRGRTPMSRSVARFGLFALLVWTLQAAAQQSSTTSVRGIVLDSDSNLPLGRVAIELRDSDSGQALYAATSSEDGRFAIPNVLPRRYRLIVSRSGFLAPDYGDQGR